MNGHHEAEIRNLLKPEHVVRKLRVKGNNVELDCCDGNGFNLTIPINTEITYEPWFMDRGSMLFRANNLPPLCYGTAKICTEADIVQFPDGTQHSIEP